MIPLTRANELPSTDNEQCIYLGRHMTLHSHCKRPLTSSVRCAMLLGLHIPEMAAGQLTSLWNSSPELDDDVNIQFLSGSSFQEIQTSPSFGRLWDQARLAFKLYSELRKACITKTSTWAMKKRARMDVRLCINPRFIYKRYLSVAHQ